MSNQNKKSLRPLIDYRIPLDFINQANLLLPTNLTFKEVDKIYQILMTVAIGTEFRELNERLVDAEEIIDEVIGWCDSNPKALKLSKAYLEKWIKTNK